jgi:hypothetical protein
VTQYTVLLTNAKRNCPVIKKELGTVSPDAGAYLAEALLRQERITHLLDCPYTRWVLVASGDGAGFPRPVAYGDING